MKFGHGTIRMQCMRLLGVLGMLACGIAAAQTLFPVRPITGIIPFGTGGPSDIISRIVGTAMSHDLGQAIIMQNKPGVGGNLGIAAVAASKPDGYTLLFCSIATTQNPAIFRTLPYDPRELVAVAIFGESPYLVGVSATKIPSRTLAEFIDLLKQSPGKYNIAGAGGQRMTMEKFMLQFGVKLEVINFKSAGDATAALMGGQVDLQLNNVSTLAPGARGGTIRLLAVAGDSRLKAIPTVPTTREAGFPDYVDKGYVGLYLRTGTPADIVARLHESARRALASPEVLQRFESLDYVPTQMTQPQADAFYRSEIARWKEVVRIANIPQVDE